MTMAYYRRSRSGCLTCKQRRVKCDEQRPSCAQCEERLVSCGGYLQQLKWADEKPCGLHNTTTTSFDQKLSCFQQAESRGINEELASSMRQNKFKRLSLARLKHQISSNFTVNLDLYKIHITNSRDRILLEYSLSTFSKLVSLNGSRSAALQAMRFINTMDNTEIMFPATIAVAAAHLFARGAITKLEFFEKKQRALQIVRLAVAIPRTAEARLRRTGHLTTPRATGAECRMKFPARCHDHIIQASIKLVSIELIQGSNFQIIYPLLYGTAALVKERHHFAEQMGDTGLEAANISSPHFVLAKRLLAYFDIMSCVPCARQPILDEAYWLNDDACKKQENIDGSGLEPVMGCFSAVIGLTGKCATLVNQYFGGEISTAHFVEARRHLTKCLEAWVPLARYGVAAGGSGVNIPSHTQDIAIKGRSIKDQEYLACVSTGNAHSLATQIFLIRSTDFDQESQTVFRLVQSLQHAVSKVPIESAAMTTMLWPLWVLACECYGIKSQNDDIKPLFQKLLEVQGFFHISKCVKVFQERIWKLRSISSNTDSRDSAPYISKSMDTDLDSSDADSDTVALFLIKKSGNDWLQSQWVRYCWEEKVELILA